VVALAGSDTLLNILVNVSDRLSKLVAMAE
jgi:hypothetical protein